MPFGIRRNSPRIVFSPPCGTISVGHHGPDGLEDLKQKTPTELLAFAEEHEIENASAMLKQDMLFAILKNSPMTTLILSGRALLRFCRRLRFLRSPDANYLPGPDDIYVSPSQIRRFAVRSGDTVQGEIAVPKMASVILRC